MGRYKEEYGFVNTLYKAGKIQSLPDIFEHVTQTMVAKDLNISRKKLSQLIKHPEHFTLKLLFTMGKLFGLKEREIGELAHKHRENLRAGRLTQSTTP